MPLRYYAVSSDSKTPIFIEYLPIYPEFIVKDEQKKLKLRIPLNDLGSIDRILPSLSLLTSEEYSFQFSLSTTIEGDELFLVPCGASCNTFYQHYLANEKVPSMGTRVDYFSIDITNVDTVFLNVYIKSINNIDLRHLTVYVSTRDSESSFGNTIDEIVQLEVPELSQMVFNSDIKNRICSAISVSMILQYYSQNFAIQTILDYTYNEAEKVYGVWPEAPYATSLFGIKGCVGFMDQVSQLIMCLKQGCPIVASIQYDKDLPGSPLKSTKGHLVVITGVTPDYFIVNDPAITGESVSIHYEVKPFLRAWSQSGFAFYSFFG